MSRVVTWEEVKRHNAEDDMWMVLHGRVYDVTEIAKAHPGGMEVLMPCAGADGTGPFEEVGHSTESRKWCARYEIGVIEGAASAPGILQTETATGRTIDPQLLNRSAGSTLAVLILIVGVIIGLIVALRMTA